VTNSELSELIRKTAKETWDRADAFMAEHYPDYDPSDPQGYAKRKAAEKQRLIDLGK
jgi:hypothetical protein